MNLYKVSVIHKGGFIIKQYLVTPPVESTNPGDWAIGKIAEQNRREIEEGFSPLYPTDSVLSAEPVLCTEDYCEI